jgi:hypothetical protein
VKSDADLSVFKNVLDFYSEVCPLGVIGSYILDRLPTEERIFSFKHHYIMHALESEVVLDIAEAMRKEKEIEIERVTALREKLQDALGGIDLGPRSKFWNYGLSTSTDDVLHVQPVKLVDGDNYFDLAVPLQELAFAWLRVHPTIASSYQAWERGEFPAETQFYVADEDIENAVMFKKKQLINKAIVKFDSMTPEKKRKVARLLGLPVSEDTKEEAVYNQVDNLLKQTEFKNGKYQGLNPVEIFGRFADMKENLLHIKDLVKQALLHSVYRTKPNGRIYEGEYEVAIDEEELVKFLVDEDNQDELLTLEQKLKSKKLASV